MISSENIIPLAAMFQTGYLINDIAYHGTTDQAAFETCINSILVTDSDTVLNVYGDNIQNLKIGFDLIAHMFDKENKQRDLDIARYVLAVIHLEKKLRKNHIIENKLSAGIIRVKNQAEIFSPTHENVIANIADVYAETISTIQPKIMVSGEPNILTDTGNANKIRALLLALMRSTIMWLQKGGSRWDLILRRNKIIDEAKQIQYRLD